MSRRRSKKAIKPPKMPDPGPRLRKALARRTKGGLIDALVEFARDDRAVQRRLVAHFGLETPPAPRVVFAQTARWLAVRKDRYKLLVGLADDGTVDELYDLRDDPGERVNLVDRLPDVHRELRQHADRHRERIASWTLPPAEPVELDEATRQRLRDLGYLQ